MKGRAGGRVAETQEGWEKEEGQSGVRLEWL
jgi:hypothetical protein